jgi:hypothetical protein
MKFFSIDQENNITAFAKRVNAEAATGDTFRGEAELNELAAGWPASRLVEMWNGIPGCVPVKKFTNRKTAVLRIWKEIQTLDGGVAAHAANFTSKESPAGNQSIRVRTKTRRGQTGDPIKPTAEVVARADSKTAKVLAMLRRTEGATLQQIMSFTSWQAHSVRGFVSGTLGKKLHLTVVSAKGEDGQRRYSITA